MICFADTTPVNLAQECFDVAADIVTFGKVIGGGLPVGAFAARKEIMDYLAPVGPVYQAGTLSGNPLAMAAGFTTLSILNEQPDIYESIANKTAYLEDEIGKILKESGEAHTINRYGSMISVHFHSEAVTDFESAKRASGPKFNNFFHGMLAQGVYLAPSAFETWFITQALTQADLDQTLDAVRKTVAKGL